MPDQNAQELKHTHEGGRARLVIQHETVAQLSTVLLVVRGLEQERDDTTLQIVYHIGERLTVGTASVNGILTYKLETEHLSVRLVASPDSMIIFYLLVNLPEDRVLSLIIDFASLFEPQRSVPVKSAVLVIARSLIS